MKIRVLSRETRVPTTGRNTAYLRVDRWNDFSFVTMFQLALHDDEGRLHEVGDVKIAFKGQTTEVATFTKLQGDFESLGEEFFSLGQGIDFYRNMAALPRPVRVKLLTALRDIVLQPSIIDDIKEEDVFGTSLLRSASLSVVKGQYARVLAGQAELTDFTFRFSRPETERLGRIELDFDVEVGSTPNSNVHAVIGRNGVGKTTVLNDMIRAITDPQVPGAKFFDRGSDETQEIAIPVDYFSSLVSVSFSAFDPFTPPKEQPDPAKGTCYFYIGLKDKDGRERHRTIRELQGDCAAALSACFSDRAKTDRWRKSIDKLGSDEIFASMRLERLEDAFRELRDTSTGPEQSDSTSFRERYQEAIAPFLERMSSGHAVVLLTVTRLVATVEEKTLVLLDEPESHLHPPLLSALMRALSDLLNDRNGVAIVATHSPVVLQEVPSTCVTKIYRVGSAVTASRPTIETFGENVGLLTSEVFGLEVEQSGFHDLLAQSVSTGKTYDEILADYRDRLGFEGRAVLKALVANRNRAAQR